MKSFAFFLLLMGTASALYGQQRRILHQTFDLEDIGALSFDLRDSSHVVESWAGATLLVETVVQMWEETANGRADAPEAIFKHFVEKGRYQLTGVLIDGKVLSIRAKDTQHTTIRTAKGACSEEVSVRFMLPESFQKTGERSWARVVKE